MGTLKWYALLNNNAPGNNRPEPFSPTASLCRKARPLWAMLECPSPREITLAEQTPEAAVFVTAHRLEDYRKRGTEIVMLPDISLPVDGILEVTDELILL